jgi:hypothetical protein
MNKKLRKKEKRFWIKQKKLIKESAKSFCVANPWPSRGIRVKHIKDDDAFELICWNYINSFKYPLD